jgi:hypothetical protein
MRFSRGSEEFMAEEPAIGAMSPDLRKIGIFANTAYD